MVIRMPWRCSLSKVPLDRLLRKARRNVSREHRELAFLRTLRPMTVHEPWGWRLLLYHDQALLLVVEHRFEGDAWSGQHVGDDLVMVMLTALLPAERLLPWFTALAEGAQDGAEAMSLVTEGGGGR